MIGDERVEEIRAGKLGRLKAVQELLDDREELLRTVSAMEQDEGMLQRRIEKLDRVAMVARKFRDYPSIDDALRALDEEKA